MIRFILRLLRRRPVVVQTYRVEKSRRRINEKCQQLAKELGRKWTHI